MKERRILIGVLIVGLLLILAVGIIQAQGSGPEDDTSAGGVEEGQSHEILNGYSSLRVAGAAMRPRDSDVEWNHVPHPNEGCTYASSGIAGRCWTTPLYLPQGATVKNLRMYFNDTNVGSNSQGFFTVYDLYGVAVEEWSVQSSGSGGYNLRNSVEFTHTIDYELYSYILKWRPNDTGTDTQLCGFRIFYYPPTSGVTFLPIVQKDD